MLEPVKYEFPPEAEAFTRQTYTARAKAITAKSNAERRKITGQAIALGVVCFLSVFALGFGGAAVVDQGWENIQNTRIANVEQ